MAITIHVRTPTGQHLVQPADPLEPICFFKARVGAALGFLDLDKFSLLFREHELAEQGTVAFAGLVEGSSVDLCLSIRSGRPLSAAHAQQLHMRHILERLQRVPAIPAAALPNFFPLGLLPGAGLFCPHSPADGEGPDSLSRSDPASDCAPSVPFSPPNTSGAAREPTTPPPPSLVPLAPLPRRPSPARRPTPLPQASVLFPPTVGLSARGHEGSPFVPLGESEKNIGNHSVPHLAALLHAPAPTPVGAPREMPTRVRCLKLNRSRAGSTGQAREHAVTASKLATLREQLRLKRLQHGHACHVTGTRLPSGALACAVSVPVVATAGVCTRGGGLGPTESARSSTDAARGGGGGAADAGAATDTTGSPPSKRAFGGLRRGFLL